MNSGEKPFELHDNCIPAKTACPFRNDCAFFDESRCPTPEKLKETKFSCFAARAWVQINKGSDNVAIRNIMSKDPIRKFRPLREDEK